ncbi:hypothetical protein WA026_012063 [Henosepilachna vigintioctopunctata]|uniref:Nucleoplasmin core domain-containing protein n=1 Tax=Henosepilachna vigintioctopunctata TaxID=420089 RepID=A0AAW1VF24_9CUCU
MIEENFYALTLKGAKSDEVWDPEDFNRGHKLIIKQALLGPEAVEGEVNVLQVEAMTWKDCVKIPVATLKAGGPNNQVLLDLCFPDPPVIFSLIQGNGPVHIIGTSVNEVIGEMDEDEEEEEADDYQKPSTSASYMENIALNISHDEFRSLQDPILLSPPTTRLSMKRKYKKWSPSQLKRKKYLLLNSQAKQIQKNKREMLMKKYEDLLLKNINLRIEKEVSEVQQVMLQSEIVQLETNEQQLEVLKEN